MPTGKIVNHVYRLSFCLHGCYFRIITNYKKVLNLIKEDYPGKCLKSEINPQFEIMIYNYGLNNQDLDLPINLNRLKIGLYGTVLTDKKGKIVAIANHMEKIYHFLIRPLIRDILEVWGSKNAGIIIHASAVKIKSNQLILFGDTLSGKSTLTSYLVLQGAQFVADDSLFLQYDKSVSKIIINPMGAFMKIRRDVINRVLALPGEIIKKGYILSNDDLLIKGNYLYKKASDKLSKIRLKPNGKNIIIRLIPNFDGKSSFRRINKNILFRSLSKCYINDNFLEMNSTNKPLANQICQALIEEGKGFELKIGKDIMKQMLDIINYINSLC